MKSSSPSDGLLLPFGSLTGIIPVDAVGRGRVVGDFGTVLAGSCRRPSEIQRQIHSLIDPRSGGAVRAMEERETVAVE